MTCFPESTYAFYVDDELQPDEARTVEAHLVQCRSCRALVVALRDEAHLLSDVLHERARQSYRLAPRTAPPPRELALGLVPAVLLGAVALAVAGWILEVRLPTGIAWLNPLRAQGAYELVFDLLFLIRDEIPGLVELVAASAAVATVSLLLLFVVAALSRRFTGTFALGLAAFALLAAPSPSSALELHFQEDEVEVPAGKTIEQTLIVNADTVRVDGTIEGDLIVVLAERLILRGEVHGNVFCSARTIENSGKVTGNFHAVGESVRLDGQVGGNMYSLSELVTLSPSAQVGRDSTHAASGASIEGEVKRDLFVIGDWVEVSGNVDRDVDARVKRAALLDGARVGGDVDVLFWRENQVEVAPGAVVGGEIRSRVHERGRLTWFDRYTNVHYYLWLCIRLGAAFVFGMVLYVFVPVVFHARLESAAAVGRSLGLGFVALVATPIALVFLALTLVGIPLAAVGLAVFATALYTAGIVVAALLGSGIAKPEVESARSFGLALLLGLVLVMVACEIPFVGGPLRFAVVLTGMGLLVERIRSVWPSAPQPRQPSPS